MKQKILGTGLSGMVGSRIVELLSSHFEFEDLSLEKGVDITDRRMVEQRFSLSSGQVVLHLAAKTNVDGCEKDRDKDEKILISQDTSKKRKYFKRSTSAQAINVEGTRNIVENCERYKKRLIYISTDFVFDGKKPVGEGYIEKDNPNPINWYGKTKYEGEKIVQKLNKMALICRIAYPYRAKFTQKLDFVRLMKQKLERNEQISALVDHIFTPTFIDDIVWTIYHLIKKEKAGVYHVVGSQSLTPYKAVCMIAKEFNLDKDLVKPIKMSTYFNGRAPRPKNLFLKNDKIKGLGIRMKTFKEGLKGLKKQIVNY